MVNTYLQAARQYGWTPEQVDQTEFGFFLDMIVVGAILADSEPVSPDEPQEPEVKTVFIDQVWRR